MTAERIFLVSLDVAAAFAGGILSVNELVAPLDELGATFGPRTGANRTSRY